MRRIHCLERKTNKNNNCRSFHGDEAKKNILLLLSLQQHILQYIYFRLFIQIK